MIRRSRSWLRHRSRRPERRSTAALADSGPFDEADESAPRSAPEH